jgi:hypothetical protein
MKKLPNPTQDLYRYSAGENDGVHPVSSYPVYFFILLNQAGQLLG